MNHIRQKIVFFKIIDKIVDAFAVILSFYLSIVFESLYHNHAILPFNGDSVNPASLIISIFIFIFTISYIERHIFYRLS